MIALPQELPYVYWQNKRNVPLSEGWLAESIDSSACRAGYADWEWTADITKALSCYLRQEFQGCLISPSELQVLIKKSILSIGYPDVAHKLSLVAPRVTIYLPDLAHEYPYELLFFPQLEKRLQEVSRVLIRGVRLEGLRPCVKHLHQAGRWRNSCEELSREIVSFTRLKLQHHRSGPTEIIIR